MIREVFNQFPYIGLEKNKFSFLSGSFLFYFILFYLSIFFIFVHLHFQDNYNLDDSGRKKFFERVAKLMKFDPNIAENWYSVARQDILHVKVCFLPLCFLSCFSSFMYFEFSG